MLLYSPSHPVTSCYVHSKTCLRFALVTHRDFYNAQVAKRQTPSQIQAGRTLSLRMLSAAVTAWVERVLAPAVNRQVSVVQEDPVASSDDGGRSPVSDEALTDHVQGKDGWDITAALENVKASCQGVS